MFFFCKPTRTAAPALLLAGALAACSSGSSDPAPVNTAPVVEAGADQTVFETRSVTLTASVTDPGDTPTIAWRQLSGPSVALSDATALAPVFATPALTADAVLVFEVEADDGVNAPAVDTVTINVRNVDPIGVVSPPNPHIFPLVLAMAEDASLPFTLYPVAGGSGVGPLFDDGSADAVFVFSYIGARLRANGSVPDLQLLFPFTWRGFFQIADSSVTSFADLIGATVLVAGPVGTSENGGGDIIFRAGAARQGVDPDTDMTVQYVAGISAASEILFAGDADALGAPAPASTGLVLYSMTQGGSLAPAIDYQELFNGPDAIPDYPSIPENQMPLGGLHASAASLETPGKRAALELLIEVYADAAARLIADPTSHAPLTAEAFADVYVDTGAPVPPAPTITAAIVNGALLYRSDIALAQVKDDLDLWITELLGAAPDADFYNETFDAP